MDDADIITQEFHNSSLYVGTSSNLQSTSSKNINGILHKLLYNIILYETRLGNVVQQVSLKLKWQQTSLLLVLDL